jgi:proteasome lid subunit RPN8/RPN11
MLLHVAPWVGSADRRCALWARHWVAVCSGDVIALGVEGALEIKDQA